MTVTKKKNAILVPLLFLTVLILLIIFVPVQRKKGIIDTTKNTCISQPTIVKRYHILLGQHEDYTLAAQHLVTDPKIHCGQAGDFRLYL